MRLGPFNGEFLDTTGGLVLTANNLQLCFRFESVGIVVQKFDIPQFIPEYKSRHGKVYENLPQQAQMYMLLTSA